MTKLGWIQMNRWYDRELLMMLGTTDDCEWDRRHVICTGRKSLLRKEVSMLGKRDLYLLA